jgi:uncharacterized protein YecE (DUF72 family)
MADAADADSIPSVLKPARGQLHVGTSGWDYPDWVGPFYAEGTSRREFLERYAERYGSVEIDSTFYRMPTTKDVERWCERVPPHFRFSPKVPQEITHEKLLIDVAEPTKRLVDALSAFGDRLGVVVVQMRYFRQSEGIELFPPTMRVALEVRNKGFWSAPVLDVLQGRGRGLVLIDHPWMEPPARIAKRRDVLPAPYTYVRLLGDRVAIEKITTTWEKQVVDPSDRLAAWAEMIARTLEDGRDVWLYVNNHYAGHAPATLRDLEERIRARLGG